MLRKVLVMDDDMSVLEMMHEALTYENFDVKTVNCSQTVFLEVEYYLPDVVLLDYIIKDVNGGEICHQLKSNPLTKHIPVIIMSAYPRVFESLGTYGCNSFIPKPFDLSELVKTIDDCIYG
ncbi:MAG TPA: response regulator [Pedobacter sp.]|jgi:DNA-binding response OmpR family regulator